jgi:hypothetical protein
MDGYVPIPPLPARLSRLNELAYDLWWSWTAEAREAFRDLDLPTVRAAIPRFSARRSVKATTERLYNPALPHV